MGRLSCVLLALLLMPVAKASLQVEQPDRSYGYFIGDVLLQRVNLDSLDEAVTAQNLESELRVDSYLYRMASKEITVKEQRWLELRYQVINSPPQTETIALPSVSFITESGTEETLAPWEFTIAPLTAAGTDSSPIADRRALDIIETPGSDKLKLGVVALLTTLALWLAWWVVRHFNDSHTLPFAKAYRTIKKLPVAERDSDPQAWIALHHGFNNVAGQTISNSTLDQLFAAAPWLGEYKDAIENFYTASSARFYQQSDTQPIAVSELCASLHRAEKRQAKQVKKASGRLAS